MGMSTAYTGAGTDDAESIRTIHRALEQGVTLIDTAEIYGPFTNEELVGQAISGRRDQVVLATKFGMLSPRWRRSRHPGQSPANIRVALEGSLQRLGVDSRRPLLPAPGRSEHAHRGHRGDAGRAGRRRQDPAHRALRGRARHHPPGPRHPPDHRRCSPSTRCGPGTLRQVLPVLRELGIGFVAYSPLGRGFLTGRGPLDR